MRDSVKPYYRYWGKARKMADSDKWDYHLLVYHCLDVAAVGRGKEQAKVAAKV